MTRRSRLCSLVFVLLIMAAGMLCTESATAQCSCDAGTVVVDKDVACKVDVCFKSPTTPLYCKTFSPGQPDFFLCEDGQSIYIKDCHGDYIEVTAQCTATVVIADFCCVIACLDNSSHCRRVIVKPSPILTCKCN